MSKYKVTLHKVDDREEEYLQITTEDYHTVSIVLTGKFELVDSRKK